MKVREVCNREVVIVEREDTILDAAKLMRHLHVGDVVVVESRQKDRKPVGILTDRDIVVELLAREVDISKVSIGDVMRVDLISAREDDDLSDTIEEMRQHGVRRIPVVNREGHLEGIFSLDDCLELMAEQLDSLTQLIKIEQRRECRGRP